MICQHAKPDGIGGYHCGPGGRHAGRNVSAGVCRACQGLPHDACPAAADWCERYGLPTGPDACGACTTARRPEPADPDLALWFPAAMRAVGRTYGALECGHRIATGRTEQRRCCGGQVKDVPIYHCRLTGRPAECRRCRHRTPATTAEGPSMAGPR